MHRTLHLTSDSAERIISYLRIARESLLKSSKGSPRIAELDSDLKDFLIAVRQDQFSHGWLPFPESVPSNGQKARIELVSGEIFEDTYYGGMWLTQKNSDVIAWTPCH